MGLRLAPLLLCLGFPAWAASPESVPRTLSAGATYLGGQVRYAFSPRWAGEFRYLTGTIDSSGGYTTTQVLGLRGYRFFDAKGQFRLYLGGELAAFNASERQQGVFYKAGGVAAGGFGGLEYFLGRRWALSLDVGPYLFSIKERLFGTKDVSFDFVANGSVNFYFY